MDAAAKSVEQKVIDKHRPRIIAQHRIQAGVAELLVGVVGLNFNTRKKNPKRGLIVGLAGSAVIAGIHIHAYVNETKKK